MLFFLVKKPKSPILTLGLVINEVKGFLTCSKASEVKVEKDEILKKYNIPKESFIITYFGRHNEVKGYDTLKKLGEKILEKYKDVYFLIAGKEEPLKGLNHKRWIEVGWTKDPHSIVNVANLYILPNKETYFDLALLEVLSLGIKSLLSDTGGNLYFKKDKNTRKTLGENAYEAMKEFSTFKIIAKWDKFLKEIIIN